MPTTAKRNGRHKAAGKDIRGPFDPKLLARARRIAARYQVETLAEQHGFKGVADYLRARGLARAG